MDLLIQIYNNKLLFFGIIAVVLFIIISIILIKRVSKEKIEDSRIDYEKIDGESSLFDEVLEEKEKNNSNQLDLDSMIERMQKDLDAKASEVVEKFETEQEEKSVISYQELIGNKTENTKVNDIGTKIAEELESIDTNILSNVEIEEENEIEPKEETPISKLNKKDEFVAAIKTGEFEDDDFSVEPKGKFKATEFISPIYGRQDIKIQYPTVQNMKEFKQPAKNYNKFELEQTLNMEPLNDEIRKNEDFLNALKEFRKNLE